MNLKDDLVTLKSRLENAEQEFQVKLKEVEKKEENFKRIEEKMQDLLKSYNESPLIRLNVGGKIFTTKVSTLISVKDTTFYKLLADSIDKKTAFPQEIFFDRSYTHFEVILNYLRYQQFSLSKYNKYDKEDIKDEVEYYGLTEVLSINKKEEYEVEWDQGLSKSGACTVDNSDKKNIRIHSTTCYTHFVTNKSFIDENFCVELEVAVNQTDNYLYVGLFNESYSLTGSCGCCNPANSYYVQCDGSVHINSTRTDNPQIRWNSEKVLINMKVWLNDGQKRISFHFPEKNDVEIGPFNIISGNNFKIYAGHCNSGNGEIKILACYAI